MHKLVSPFSSTTLPIGQLQIELHTWDDYGKFDLFHDWWAALEAAAGRPFWTESNLIYVNHNVPFLRFGKRTRLDIELDALTAFLSARAPEGNARPVGQLQLEIHAREGRENFKYLARWWTAGLRPFWMEPNLVYINILSESTRHSIELNRDALSSTN
ncbi:hypothetical protein EDB92DRAFT_1890480 [Lactarius akahatsu]|uniref:Uncharacterized protein n=1 Tax=Lactarius akahatsu TaxID=416441 RepID=A0AAD4L9J0_9AGAM|nr:hypothetical protein EDB92DRAFT_1890480 [Lactarius akahatsu]